VTSAHRTNIERSLLFSGIVARCYAAAMSLLSWRHRLAVSRLCHIDRKARIIGWGDIDFGRNVAIGAGSFLNVNYRGGATKSLIFGDNSFIGRDNFISVGKLVRVGAYCLTAPSCSLIGASHVADPTHPYLATGTTGQDAIVVGVNCFFGYGASVLGNVQIGHGCIIGAHALVRADVPPFSIVVGNPARVIRRFDFHTRAWLADWNDRELAHPQEQEYLQALRNEHPWPVLPLSVATSGLGDI
jgi:acetyltransferase-like isoleucine patch superfamily enzyme